MSFITHFSNVEDPRTHINVKHDFLDVVFLTVSAVLSGAEGWSDIELFGKDKLSWLRRYRKFENGIPVDDTIARIIRVICPKQLNQAFISWVNEVRIETGKKNDHASVLELLDTLDIKGALINADAMNSQTKIVKKIHDKKADYLMCIKNNHKTLREEISAYFHKVQRDTPDFINSDEHTDAGHGRIEVRRCQQLLVNEWISEAKNWVGIQSVIKLERERHIDGKPPTFETQYYISSLRTDARQINRAIRSHWEVENKAHWVLDVTFKEDDCRIRKGDGAENVGVIRRFCLNMARLHPKKASMRGKLKMAGWADA